MIRWFISLSVMVLFSGCVVNSRTANDPNDRKVILNEWFKELDQVNIPLHDKLLEALFISRQTGGEVFVLRIMSERSDQDTPLKRYRVSTKRGGADNVVGVNYATGEFRLDHYLAADGPTLDEVRQHLQNRSRIRELKKDLGIFGVQ